MEFPSNCSREKQATIYLFKGTSINCHERHEYEADGAQKPECTQST